MSLTRLIPKQKRMSTTLGGMLILLSETMFMFSLLNFLLITRIQYYNPGDAYMRQLFPHYLIFLGMLIAAALLGMIFVYVFILPSKMVFSQQQAVKDDRSPTHNLLIEVNNEIKGLKKDIEALKQSLDKI
jgi:hypothetical protein